MAEMTAEEAKELLKPDGRALIKLLPTQANELAALIEQQAATIEAACELLSKTGCPGLVNVYCSEDCNTDMNRVYCWKLKIEQQVKEGQ